MKKTKAKKRKPGPKAAEKKGPEPTVEPPKEPSVELEEQQPCTSTQSLESQTALNTQQLASQTSPKNVQSPSPQLFTLPESLIPTEPYTMGSPDQANHSVTVNKKVNLDSQTATVVQASISPMNLRELDRLLTATTVDHNRRYSEEQWDEMQQNQFQVLESDDEMDAIFAVIPDSAPSTLMGIPLEYGGGDYYDGEPFMGPSFSGQHAITTNLSRDRHNI